MKKTLAILLSALVLLSTFSVQSFAALGFDKIEDFEVVTMEPFSLKSVQDYIDSFDGEELEGEDREYNFVSSFYVTLSNGETIYVPEYECGYSQDGKRMVECYVWMDVYDVLEAAENGSYTVPVHTEISLYSSLNIQIDKKVITDDVSFPKKLVKNLSLLEGEIKFYEYIPEDYEELGYSFFMASDLDKLRFKVVYEDGTEIRKYVQKVVTWGAFTEYYLDGQMIFIYPDSETKSKDVTVEFLDIEKNFSAKIFDCPFESITIDDATFDDDFNEKTVTITVTDTKGKEKTYTRNLENYTEFIDRPLPGVAHVSRVYEIGKLHGMPVLVEVEDGVEDGGKNNDVICKDFTVAVDGVHFASERFRGAEVKLTLLERFIEIITNLFYEIFYIFG